MISVDRLTFTYPGNTEPTLVDLCFEIARGEVVVIDDRFGVRITDVIPPAQRVASLK